MEDVYTPYGAKCDGGVIGISSLCCLDGDAHYCQYDECHNHEDATDAYNVDEDTDDGTEESTNEITDEGMYNDKSSSMTVPWSKETNNYL